MRDRRCSAPEAASGGSYLTLCGPQSKLRLCTRQVCIKNINAHINFVLTFLGRLHPAVQTEKEAVLIPRLEGREPSANEKRQSNRAAHTTY